MRRKHIPFKENVELLQIGEILCQRQMTLGRNELIIPFPCGEDSSGETLHRLFGLFSSAVRQFEEKKIGKVRPRYIRKIRRKNSYTGADIITVNDSSS